MSTTAATPRYAKRPFLRLIDCYVLDAIGQLDDDQRAALTRMEPKLATVFGIEGSWSEIVEKQMEFPASLRTQIRGIWGRYLDFARQTGRSVDPGEFVVQFVDNNFLTRAT